MIIFSPLIPISRYPQFFVQDNCIQSCMLYDKTPWTEDQYIFIAEKMSFDTEFISNTLEIVRDGSLSVDISSTELFFYGCTCISYDQIQLSADASEITI